MKNSLMWAPRAPAIYCEDDEGLPSIPPLRSWRTQWRRFGFAQTDCPQDGTASRAPCARYKPSATIFERGSRLAIVPRWSAPSDRGAWRGCGRLARARYMASRRCHGRFVPAPPRSRGRGDGKHRANRNRRRCTGSNPARSRLLRPTRLWSQTRHSATQPETRPPFRSAAVHLGRKANRIGLETAANTSAFPPAVSLPLDQPVLRPDFLGVDLKSSAGSTPSASASRPMIFRLA